MHIIQKHVWRRLQLFTVFLITASEYHTCDATYSVRPGRIARLGENVTFSYEKRRVSWNFRSAHNGELKKIYNGRKLDPSSGHNYSVSYGEDSDNMTVLVKHVDYFNAGRYEFSDVDTGRMETEELNILGPRAVCSKFHQVYRRGRSFFRRETGSCIQSYAGNLPVKLVWTSQHNKTAIENLENLTTEILTDSYKLITLKSDIDMSRSNIENLTSEQIYYCHASVKYFQNTSNERHVDISIPLCSVHLSTLEHFVNSTTDDEFSPTTKMPVTAVPVTVTAESFELPYSSSTNLNDPGVLADINAGDQVSKTSVSPMLAALLAIIAFLVIALTIAVAAMYAIVKRRAKKSIAQIQPRYEAKYDHKYEGLCLQQLQLPNSPSCSPCEYEYPERNIYECPDSFVKDVKRDKIDEEVELEKGTPAHLPPPPPQRRPLKGGTQNIQPEYEEPIEMIEMKQQCSPTSTGSGGISVFNSGYLTVPLNKQTSLETYKDTSNSPESIKQISEYECEQEEDRPYKSIEKDRKNVSNSSASDDYLKPSDGN